MAERLKRAYFARIAVGMAALAFPLFAVGTAQAAIGGAAPETSNRADLVSATLENGGVDYCFDKQINNTPFTAGDFSISGYRSLRTVTGTTAVYEQTNPTTGECVRVTFAGAGLNAPGDTGQYTVATVQPGSGVSTFPSGLTNPLADSTALTGSSTHNGTTGFTALPDLTGVTTDLTSNTITYNEDQSIGSTPLAASFTFLRSGGTVCVGTGVSGFGSSVTITFPVGTCPVQDAVRATQSAGAVTAAADPFPVNPNPSPPETAIVPNTSGITSRPDLVSATLSADGSGIDYVFDKNVTITNPAGFEAVLSTGEVIPSTAAAVTAASTTSTTVHATFGSGILPVLSNLNEFVVEGAAIPAAVTDTSLVGNINVADSRPAGDNAGAFARGFTTGPDAISAVINHTTGLVSITLDQRAFVYTGGTIQLVDNTGNPVATAPAGSVSLPTQAAGQQTITAQFSPAQTVTAVNVSIAPFSLFTSLSGGQPQPNVVQILGSTSTSTLLQRARYARSHHQSARLFKRHEAQVRREQKAALKKLERKLHRTI